MAITPVTDRQRVLAAYVEFTHADFTSGAFTPVFQLPSDAIVIGGYVVHTTAWDSATSAVMDVGDPGDDDEYTPTQINLKTATGATALTVTGYQYTANTNVGITVTVVGAPTTGAGKLIVLYVREGRADENQG